MLYRWRLIGAALAVMVVCLLCHSTVLAADKPQRPAPGNEGLELLLTVRLQGLVDVVDLKVSSDDDANDRYYVMSVAYLDTSPDGNFALACRTIVMAYVVAEEVNISLAWVQAIPVNQSARSVRAVIAAAPGRNRDAPRLFRILYTNAQKLSPSQMVVARDWWRSWKFDIKDPLWKKPEIP